MQQRQAAPAYGPGENSVSGWGLVFGSLTIACLIVALALSVWTPGVFLVFSEGPTLRLATGSTTGTYFALGTALRTTNSEVSSSFALEVLKTNGSVDNMQLVADGEAELAFVQSDTEIRHDVALVAELYQEVLYILVRAEGEVRMLDELRGKRVFLGMDGSGAQVLARRLMHHFHIEVEEVTDLSPDASLKAVRDGSVEAAFILASMPSRQLQVECERGGLRLLSLHHSAPTSGEDSARSEVDLATAFVRYFPAYQETIIPARIFGSSPVSNIRTISVSALLVASQSVARRYVYDLTETLFEQRVLAAQTAGRVGQNISPSPHSLVQDEDMLAAIIRGFREDHKPEKWMMPYHSGATSYYTRRKPSFFVKYAEPVSLVVTVMLATMSALVAVLQWSSRWKKNRIDRFYNQVMARTDEVHTGEVEDLEEIRIELLEIRRRAFEDLVNERLNANESFTIFQDFLRSELQVIEERLKDSKSR